MKNKRIAKSDIILIIKIFKYARSYKIRFSIAFLCVISTIVFSIIQPLVWARILTNLFSINFSLVITNILYLSLIFIAQTLINYLQSYLFSYLNENIIYDLKSDMYKCIIDLPVKAFDEMRVGEFISRLQTDASAVVGVITNQLLNTFVDILRVIIIGIYMYSINIPLALIVTIAFPISFYISLHYGNKIKIQNKVLLGLMDTYFSYIQQSILGIREIKNLGAKKANFESFLSLANKVKDKNIEISVTGLKSSTLSQGINFLTLISVMSLGGFLIFKEFLIMEYFIAFFSYSNQFTSSLMNVTKLNLNIHQTLASLERIFNLMNNLNYSKENLGNLNVKCIKGSIEFDQVFFEYNNNAPVLKGISFFVSHNKKVAIVGSSGGGKSTIFNLLQRFYEPSSGLIRIDNIDLKQFDEDSLRSHLSVVRQDPFLFNISIKDNLLLANPTACENEIIEVCKIAYIHDYIMQLPDGYNTIVGENGINLSGGQKQRIAIARALLKKSKIILFDEATSSLDNESQYNIKNALDSLSNNHTVIIIAHRLTTIIGADEIIVVEDGKIVGKGNHKSLIESNDVYKRLYSTELNELTA